MVDHLGDQVVHRLRTFGAQSLDAEGLGKCHEVRERVRVALGVTAPVKELLPLADHAEVLVVDDEDLDRKPVLLNRREFLQVHHERRLAGDAHHQPLGIGDLGADRRREAVAHGAETARRHPAQRALEVEELGRPHLVLADFGRHVGVTAGECGVEAFQCVLRLDALAAVLVLEAVAGLPAPDRPPPAVEPVGTGIGSPRLPAAAQCVDRAAGVALDGHVDRHVLVDAGGVDVHVDLLRGRREGVEPTGHPVIEARAHVQHHVAVVHRHVGFVRPVHPEHAEEVRLAGRHGAEAHQRRGDREPGFANEPRERAARGRPGIHHAAPGVDDRPFGPEEEIERRPYLGGRRLLPGPIAFDGVARGRDVSEFGVLDVLGKIDDDGARSPLGGDRVGLGQHRHELTDVLDQVVVLGARARDADGVRLLEGVVADQVRGDLAGQAEHRDTVHQRIREPGDRVGRAGTGGHEHHANAAGRAGVAFRHVHGGLLVAHEDVADPVLPEDRVVDGEHGAARIAEHDLDAEVGERAHNDFCTGESHRNLRARRAGPPL